MCVCAGGCSEFIHYVRIVTYTEVVLLITTTTVYRKATKEARIMYTDQYNLPAGSFAHCAGRSLTHLVSGLKFSFRQNCFS